MSQTKMNNVKSVLPNGFMKFRDLQKQEYAETIAYEEAQAQEPDLTEIEAVLASAMKMLVHATALVLNVQEQIIEVTGDAEALTDEFEESDDPGETDTDKNGFEYDLQFLMAAPDGTMNMITVDQCFERFPWFGESEILEPLPGCRDLYLTCARENLAVSKNKKYLVGPAVIIKVNENNDEESVGISDVLKICRILAAHTVMLVNAATGKNVPAFCLE